MWEQRRQSLVDSAQILRQLPAVKPSLPQEIEKTLPKAIASQLIPLFESLPATYGTVRNVSVPAGKNANKVVIHIQDVHRNAEAQRNIAKTVQALIDSQRVGLIALEGATTPIDLTAFRAFPKNSTGKVANYLFRENKISGPIFAAFTNEKPIPAIVGIDDPVHYKANVDAYKTSSTNAEAYKQRVNSLKVQLADRKKTTLNPALYEFDLRAQSYRDGSLSLGSYVEFLSRTTVELPSALEIFLQALRLESSLNFITVEAERVRLISELLVKLDAPQTQALMAAGVAYRLGNISHVNFYSGLKTLCVQKGVLLSRFPAMDAYLRYVALTDLINAENIFGDLKKAEATVVASLVRNQSERQLIDESEQLFLAGKLLDFSLTKDAWESYKATVHGQWTIDHRLNLSSFERFYVEAEARDRAMSENLLKAMAASNTDVAILVTGGFHSAGIGSRLHSAGLTTITFSPKITKVDLKSGSAYLNVFAQEKTPLDQLFNGEKLFLAESPIPLNNAVTLALYDLQAKSNGHEGEVTTEYPKGNLYGLFDRAGEFVRVRWERRDEVLRPWRTEHWNVLNPFWIVATHKPKTVSDWVQLGMGYALMWSFILLIQVGLMFFMAANTSLSFSNIENLSNVLAVGIGVFPAHIGADFVAVLLGWRALSRQPTERDRLKDSYMRNGGDKRKMAVEEWISVAKIQKKIATLGIASDPDAVEALERRVKLKEGFIQTKADIAEMARRFRQPKYQIEAEISWFDIANDRDVPKKQADHDIKVRLKERFMQTGGDNKQLAHEEGIVRQVMSSKLNKFGIPNDPDVVEALERRSQLKQNFIRADGDVAKIVLHLREPRYQIEAQISWFRIANDSDMDSQLERRDRLKKAYIRAGGDEQRVATLMGMRMREVFRDLEHFDIPYEQDVLWKLQERSRLLPIYVLEGGDYEKIARREGKNVDDIYDFLEELGLLGNPLLAREIRRNQLRDEYVRVGGDVERLFRTMGEFSAFAKFSNWKNITRTSVDDTLEEFHIPFANDTKDALKQREILVAAYVQHKSEVDAIAGQLGKSVEEIRESAERLGVLEEDVVIEAVRFEELRYELMRDFIRVDRKVFKLADHKRKSNTEMEAQLKRLGILGSPELAKKMAEKIQLQEVYVRVGGNPERIAQLEGRGLTVVQADIHYFGFTENRPLNEDLAKREDWKTALINDAGDVDVYYKQRFWPGNTKRYVIGELERYGLLEDPDVLEAREKVILVVAYLKTGGDIEKIAKHFRTTPDEIVARVNHFNIQESAEGVDGLRRRSELKQAIFDAKGELEKVAEDWLALPTDIRREVQRFGLDEDPDVQKMLARALLKKQFLEVEGEIAELAHFHSQPVQMMKRRIESYGIPEDGDVKLAMERKRLRKAFIKSGSLEKLAAQEGKTPYQMEVDLGEVFLDYEAFLDDVDVGLRDREHYKQWFIEVETDISVLAKAMNLSQQKTRDLLDSYGILEDDEVKATQEKFHLKRAQEARLKEKEEMALREEQELARWKDIFVRVGGDMSRLASHLRLPLKTVQARAKAMKISNDPEVRQALARRQGLADLFVNLGGNLDALAGLQLETPSRMYEILESLGLVEDPVVDNALRERSLSQASFPSPQVNEEEAELDPAGSSSPEIHIAEDEERGRILRLSEQLADGSKEASLQLSKIYAPKATQVAYEYYFAMRYLAEKIAPQILGFPLSFTLTLDDFIGRANLSLVEELEGHRIAGHQSARHIYQKVFTGLPRSMNSLVSKEWNVYLPQVELLVNVLRQTVQHARTLPMGVFELPLETVLAELWARPDYTEFENRLRHVADSQNIPLEEAFPGRFEEIPDTHGSPETLVAFKQAQLNLKELRSDLKTAVAAIPKWTPPLLPEAPNILADRYGLDSGIEMNMSQVAEKYYEGTPAGFSFFFHGLLNRLNPSTVLKIYEKHLDTEGPTSIHLADSEPARPMRADLDIEEEPMVLPDSLTKQQEDSLLELVRERFSKFQLRILRYIFQGMSEGEILDAVKGERQRAASVRESLIAELKLAFTFGWFDQIAPRAVISKILPTLLLENKPERLFRRTSLDKLIEASGMDKEGVKELIEDLYPGEFSEVEVEAVAGKHFAELASQTRNTANPISRDGDVQEQVRDVADSVQKLIEELGLSVAEKRRRVLKRLVRYLYYPLMRRDEETGSKQGLKALKAQIAANSEDPFFQGLVEDAYHFYKQARPFKPRGFQATVDGHDEPLLPGQLYSVWEMLQSLENMKERCAFLTSDARTAKTITAALAAFNIRKRNGEYAVKRLLYTTTNSAKYAVADELKKRLDLEDLTIVVVDREIKKASEQIREATLKQGNVILIVSYGVGRDFPHLLTKFKADAHIIDEIENLRRAKKNQMGPAIISIPARYHIGISARLVVKSAKDVAEPLAWVRHRKFKNAQEVLALDLEQLFAAMDPVMVRWRRPVLMPDIKNPEYDTVRLKYSPDQDEILHEMRDNFSGWLATHRRAGKKELADHIFVRLEQERRASIDPLIVMDAEHYLNDAKLNQFLEHVKAQQQRGKKILAMVNLDAGIKHVVAHVNRVMGKGAALGVLDEDLPLAATNLVRFLQDEEPIVLVGRPRILNLIAEQDPQLAVFDLTPVTPKIQALFDIIREETARKGKVVVLLDFVEGIERVVGLINDKFGDGTAVGTSNASALERLERIRRFRSEIQPKVLIGTSFLLGSSINLFQIPGVPFHISRLVRLSQPWSNVDDGDRLVSQGRPDTHIHPVKVTTLVSEFATQPRVDKGGEPELTIEQMQEGDLAVKKKIFKTVIEGGANVENKFSTYLQMLAARITNHDQPGALAFWKDSAQAGRWEGRLTMVVWSVLLMSFIGNFSILSLTVVFIGVFLALSVILHKWMGAKLAEGGKSHDWPVVFAATRTASISLLAMPVIALAMIFVLLSIQSGFNSFGILSALIAMTIMFTGVHLGGSLHEKINLAIEARNARRTLPAQALSQILGPKALLNRRIGDFLRKDGAATEEETSEGFESLFPLDSRASVGARAIQKVRRMVASQA